MPPAFQTASNWTDAFLDPMRQVGDELADGVVDNLFANNSIDSVNQLMLGMIQNDYPEPSSFPPVVADYVKQLDALPEWADTAKIDVGQQVFWKYGPRLILILHCYALPFCYVGKNGVQVLALSGRLGSNSTRRILETAQLLVDLMSPGGLTAPQGRARRTIQKVRLMHAAIRHLVKKYPGWKAQFGLPVNQEDLAGTLMAFSWISLDGLRKIGVQLTPAEWDGYLHCWQIAGHQLGILDGMIPADSIAAEALCQAIERRQFGACAEGKMMTKALIESIQYQLPGDIFDDTPGLLMRYFLGDEHAGMIGVDQSLLEQSGLRSLLTLPLQVGGEVITDLVHDSAAISVLAEKLGKVLINSIVLVQRGGNRPTFTIPKELQLQWGVNWTS
jgi:hypothetical protein